jgi:hypothetical protein
MESWARHQPPPAPGQPPADPVHLVRVSVAGCPVVLLALARWSTIARLASDAGDVGRTAEITDLGRWRGRPADIPAGDLWHLGVVPRQWAA